MGSRAAVALYVAAFYLRLLKRGRVNLNWPRCTSLIWPHPGDRSGGFLPFLAGGLEAVGVGAGLDDVGVEGEPVDDGGAEARVGEGAGPFGECGVGSDGDGCFLFPLGEDLEEQFGAAAVQFEVAQLIQAEQVDAAVAGDGLGQVPVVGGLDQLVDQGCGGGVADPVTRFGGGGAQSYQQMGLAGAGVAD
jgi:hypothetical protein